MMANQALRIASLGFATFATACTTNIVAPVNHLPLEAQNAPTQVVVDDTPLQVDLYIYRNFQPGTVVDTRIIAAFQLTAAAGHPLPLGLRPEKAWIVHTQEFWASAPRQEQPSVNDNRVDFVSRQGPTWPVGDFVTGVLMLRDAGNNSYFLRSPPRAIGRAD